MKTDTNMPIKTTHASALGVYAPSSVTDAQGYVTYREGYEKLPEAEWTRAERWLHNAQASIDAFRR